MHVTHQLYLTSSLKGAVGAIEEALEEQGEEGNSAHPSLVAERKAAIILNLDNLHRYLEQLEPVLREQNQ